MNGKEKKTKIKDEETKKSGPDEMRRTKTFFF